MNKFVMNAGEDEFFMPDDTHWWWSEMPEPKVFRMVPNVDHGLGPTVIPCVLAAIKQVIDTNELPKFSWKIDVNGTGDITLDLGLVEHDHVLLYKATTCNADRRDFRMFNLDDPCVCGQPEHNYCRNNKIDWNYTIVE